MEQMFYGAESFNQSLNNWNVSNVRDMESMFSGARSFNQPLNNWDVSKVTDMPTQVVRLWPFSTSRSLCEPERRETSSA